MNMIEGVTILNKITEYKEVSGIAYILVIFAVCSGVFAIIIGVVDMSDGFYYPISIIKLISGIVFLILGIIGLICIGKITKQPTGEYQYKVTIDDTVVMSEFYEKYEVIEVEGKIYTIEEKESE